MTLSKTPKSVLKEINGITATLIRKGLAVHQSFPSTILLGGLIYISWGNQGTLSSTFKNIPYSEVYRILYESKSYNILMIDGSLIQMMYCFRGNQLISHRLAFYPCPNLPQFIENSEFYDAQSFEDEVYGEIMSREIMVFPLRFDFAPDHHEDIKHPKSHLHLGEYKDCRIPLGLPLTPNIFIDFILRNFYSTIFYKDFTNTDVVLNKIFTDSISVNESKLIHVNINF